jgi:protein-disulfide isomerase
VTLGRRRLLATVGSAAVAGLAGCVGSLGGGGSNAGDDGTPSGEPTLSTHPASRAIADQPFLGPPPGEASGTIVAFEDPSCPTCARFERETVPQIRENLTDPGDATFVFRGIPVVYEWGLPATRALEATFAVDADAFWTLAEEYFADQSRFRGQSADVVYAMTEDLLEAETGVDAAAVVESARAGEADAAVETDLSASEDAEVRATPTVFLFRDGEFRTQIRGMARYDVLAGALGF